MARLPHNGEISSSRLAVLKKTKSQKAKMANFSERGGDEGAGKHSGSPIATGNTVDKNQRDRVDVPSKGGRAGREVQPIRANQINDSIDQKPDNPRTGSGGRNAPVFSRSPIPGGGKPVPSGKGKIGTPAKAKGPIAKTGSIYGGGGRNTQ